MPRLASAAKDCVSSEREGFIPFTGLSSPDFIFAIHSLQYTGRPGSGSNGTNVSLPQLEHTALNFPSPDSEPPPSMPLQALISFSTSSRGLAYSLREDSMISCETFSSAGILNGGSVLAENGREVTPSTMSLR